MTRALGLVLSLAILSPAGAAEPVALSDGKDMSKWYTFLRDHGKDKDPNKTFTVKDGILRISGQDFGALTTRDEYANYEVEVVYAWGGKVWPPREKNARDCGLILHAAGPDGTVGKSRLEGFQCNMIEGGTGDISITGANKKYLFKAQAEERPAGKKSGFYWKGRRSASSSRAAGCSGPARTPAGKTSSASAAGTTWRRRSASGTRWSSP
jgi:hypothetical protein